MSNSAVNRVKEREYPIEEFVKLKDLIEETWPGIDPVTASTWCKTGRYPHAIKRSKFWYVHPEQFKAWWRDVGP